MHFTFNILLTDVLLYLLVAAVVSFIFYTRKHEHLLAPWKQLKFSKLAMSALVILLFFVTAGVLDSIHFRQEINTENKLENQTAKYSNEVSSVLDLMLTTIRVQTEKTYSAPFAIHSFSKEITDSKEEGASMFYPRLKYGGAHLKDNELRLVDIGNKLLQAIIWSSITLVALIILIAKLLVKDRESNKFLENLKRVLKGEASTPWRTILLAAFIPVLLIFCIVELGPYYHIMGTDQVGNDVLYKTIKSIRTGLLIGTLTTLVMLPFAILFGIMAGYFRGWVDDVIQYIYTTLSSIPGVLLIAATILSLDVYMANHQQSFSTLVDRSDARLLFLCLILGIMSWTGLCRLLRAETLKLREQDYIQAAVSLGVRHRKVMSRHIFPNLMHIVLISIALDFSGLVLAEAVLSYVGVGVDPTMDSWGNMINGARLEMAREPVVWWNLSAAFIFMFTLVLSANIFSDAVRDAFDPKLRAAS